MPPKRSGSVKTAKRADGSVVYKAYIGKLYYGTHDTPAEAQAAIDAQLFLETSKPRQSFGKLFEQYMSDEAAAAERRGRARVFKKEIALANRHVRSAPWYDAPLKSIHAKHVQAHVVAVMQTPSGQFPGAEQRLVGRRTAARVLSRLRGFFAAQLIAGRIDDNPATACRLPFEGVPVGDDEGIVFAYADELEALFALELPPRERAALSVATYVGLRCGELFGLRWENLVRLGQRRPEVQVRWSYDGPTKTRGSRRDVPLLQPAERALIAYRDSLPLDKRTGLVWPNPEGVCHAEGYAFHWYDEAGKPGWRTLAGIRDSVQFRHLRHTCGSHLLQGTWGVKLEMPQVSRWLGHSSIAVTMRHYASVMDREGLHAAVEQK